MGTKRVEEIKKSIEVEEKEEHVLREIGWFYHNLYSNDLNEAFESIKNLGIYKVVVDEDTIYICLERPGLLIGVKGSNIEALEKHLKEAKINQNIQVIEVRRSRLDILTSWQYAYMDFNDI